MSILSIIISISLRVYRYSIYISVNTKWKKKIRALLNIIQTKKLSGVQKKEIQSFYKNFGVQNVCMDWHRYYSDRNGNFSSKYLPENLFYLKVEPHLNRQDFVDAMEDKNLLDKFFDSVKHPEIVVKNSNGIYHLEGAPISKKKALTLCNDQGGLIIKPTLDTGGGKNVVLFKCQNGLTDYNNCSIAQLFGKYKMDFIVQKVVVQHPIMSSLNSSSLNTFRVLSYLTSEQNVELLSTIVRMGREGTFTDNSTTGGLSAGVQGDGSLTEKGFQNLNGTIHYETDSGTKFSEITLPFIEKIEDCVKRLHKKAPYFKLISWDLAIDDNGDVILIEYNVKGQDINFHQVNNGPVFSPLFKEISDGKVALSLKHKYKIMF